MRRVAQLVLDYLLKTHPSNITNMLSEKKLEHFDNISFIEVLVRIKVVFNQIIFNHH